MTQRRRGVCLDLRFRQLCFQTWDWTAKMMLGRHAKVCYQSFCSRIVEQLKSVLTCVSFGTSNTASYQICWAPVLSLQMHNVSEYENCQLSSADGARFVSTLEFCDSWDIFHHDVGSCRQTCPTSSQVHCAAIMQHTVNILTYTHQHVFIVIVSMC